MLVVVRSGVRLLLELLLLELRLLLLLAGIARVDPVLMVGRVDHPSPGRAVLVVVVFRRVRGVLE